MDDEEWLRGSQAGRALAATLVRFCCRVDDEALRRSLTRVLSPRKSAPWSLRCFSQLKALKPRSLSCIYAAASVRLGPLPAPVRSFVYSLEKASLVFLAALRNCTTSVADITNSLIYYVAPYESLLRSQFFSQSVSQQVLLYNVVVRSSMFVRCVFVFAFDFCLLFCKYRCEQRETPSHLGPQSNGEWRPRFIS